MTEITYWRSAKIPTVQYGARDICLTLKSQVSAGEEEAEYLRLKTFVDQKVEEQAAVVTNDTSKLRVRTKDGKKYPSVTSIISPDPINIPNIDKYSLKGIEYHLIANHYLLTQKLIEPRKEIDISPLKWDIDIKGFFERYGQRFGKFELNKEVFHENHMYSGEIDFIGYYNDKLTLGDFKTGGWKLEQLVAYERAYGAVEQLAIFDLKNCMIETWDLSSEESISDIETNGAWENFLKLRGRFAQRFNL